MNGRAVPSFAAVIFNIIREERIDYMQKRERTKDREERYARF